MRRIDADNFKARLKNSYKRREYYLRTLGVSTDVKGIVDSLIDVIDEEPTVAPVKRGHWIQKPTSGVQYYQDYECSECGLVVPNRELQGIVEDGIMRYCPNCGALMQEDKDESETD